MLTNGIYQIEGARITFRNFRGEERQYNDPGDRNFNLILTQEQADECAAIGFNVKTVPPRDDGGDPQYRLQVAVSFKNRPPKVVQITRRNKVYLGEETIGELDYAEFSHIDLTIRPYHWKRPNGDHGVKAYLNTMYVTLMEDNFAAKYDDIPDSEAIAHPDPDALPFGD